MSRGVLALDQGSHASRACIFDSHGALLATAIVPVATRHPAPLQVEQDAVELLESVRAAATQALHAARAHLVGQVESLALPGYGPGKRPARSHPRQ